MLAGEIPAGLPADMADAARATLGGAIDVSKQLPAEAGAALIEASREAFLRGLQLAALISVVGSIALAIFAAVTLRNSRGSAHATEETRSEPAVSEALGLSS